MKKIVGLSDEASNIVLTLAKQAGYDVDTMKKPYPGGFPKDDLQVLEDFAQLIIEHCADLVQVPGNSWPAGLIRRTLLKYEQESQ